MLVIRKGEINKYDYNSDKFKVAFEFLENTDLCALEPGKITLEKGVFVSVQKYKTLPEAECKYETHENYFDIQYIASGKEYIGVVSREGLTEKAPYNPEKDITFYSTPENTSKLLLLPGDFVIVGPEDAHQPKCAVNKPEDVIKIVVKVPV